jgi:hypothetical protein
MHVLQKQLLCKKDRNRGVTASDATELELAILPSKIGNNKAQKIIMKIKKSFSGVILLNM